MGGIAKSHGVPLAAAAMRFPLHDPNVATVLVGTAKPSGLQRNLDNLEMQVPQEAWQAFDDLAMNK